MQPWTLSPVKDECGCLFFFLIAETLKYMEFFFLDKNTEYKQSTKNQNSIIANISAACKLPMLGCQYFFHQKEEFIGLNDITK